MPIIMDWSNFAHFPCGSNTAMGYLASALVLATFSTKSMRLLRSTAIVSNAAFLTYALAADLAPIVVLHGILLPLNIFRLAQIEVQKTSLSK